MASPGNPNFCKGNKLGKGNPFNRRVQALRAKMIQFADTGKLQKLCEVLYDRALAGDMVAAKELLERWLGKEKGDLSVNLSGGVAVQSVDPLGLSRLSIVERETLLALVKKAESDAAPNAGSDTVLAGQG